MPGMFGAFGEVCRDIDIPSVLATLDPLSTADTKTLSLNEGIIAVSSLANTPMRGPRYYEDSQYAACFSGDLIEAQMVPWDNIINIIKEETYEKYSEYNGFFTFAVYDKKKEKLYIVGDNFSFHPIYYYINDGTALFSTSISTFGKLKDPQDININWLYEYIYFSHPMSDATIYKDVYRMPPASVLRVDLDSGDASLIAYGRCFERAEKPLKGREAIEKALTVFKERMPKYFDHVDKFAHALTGGYDTRTILSFVPKDMRHKMLTYTYGIEGCDDLLDARMIARALNLSHMEIYFDDKFLDRLPSLIYETIYLSGGLENINRSYLPYIYRILTDNGQDHSIIISGIAADAIFRGHAPSPHYISHDMERVFISGEKYINKEFFKRVYRRRFDDFYQYIDGVLDGLQDRYGEFGSLRTFFTFMINKLLPKHFDGEVSVANNFGAFRMPFFDSDLIQLSCDIEYSLFKFLSLFHDDRYRESYLQACLIERNADLAKVPMDGLPLKAFSSNSKFIYNWYRVLKKGPRKAASFIKSSPRPMGEDWESWYKTTLSKELDMLFSKDSIVSNYIDVEFLKRVRRENNVHWIKIIATVEVALRLAADRWNRL